MNAENERTDGSAGLADAALDARLTEGLVRRPEITIPHGFAARVAGEAVRQPGMARPDRVADTRVGRLVLWSTLPLLLLMICAIAASAVRSPIGVLIQSALAFELALLAFWLSRKMPERS